MNAQRPLVIVTSKNSPILILKSIKQAFKIQEQLVFSKYYVIEGSLYFRKSCVHCTELYRTALHRTALHCTTLHCTALHCTVLHCTAQHCTALHCTELHCTELHCTALHCTALH